MSEQQQEKVADLRHMTKEKRDQFLEAHVNNFPATYLRDHAKAKWEADHEMTSEKTAYHQKIDQVGIDPSDDGFLKDQGFTAGGWGRKDSQ